MSKKVSYKEIVWKYYNWPSNWQTFGLIEAPCRNLKTTLFSLDKKSCLLKNKSWMVCIIMLKCTFYINPWYIYVVFISCHGSWADFFLLSLFTLLCFCHSKLSHTALLGNNLDIGGGSYSGNTDRILWKMCKAETFC